MADVVVVGAGVGGLAAAARLAAAGHRVTVLEQAEVVGGKLGVHRADGFTWDTGPSLLTMPHVVAELFAATGAPLRAVLDLVPVDPVARYRFPDGTWFDAAWDVEALCANLDAALGPAAGAEWRRFLARASRVYEAVRVPFLSSPLDGPADLLRQSLRLRDLATIAPWSTLRALGTRYLGDPRLRMLLDRYATYTGSDPRRAPAALASVPWVEQAFGGWYVRGGLRRLGEAIADRAVERGAALRTGAAVAALEPGGARRWTVRLGDGETLHAEVVVANADAAHLYGDLLPAAVARGPLRSLRRAEASLSGFVLLLGLRGRTPGLAHHTVLFPADYDAEFDALFGPAPVPVADPTIYVSAPDDPALAPPGDEAWFVLVNAPRQGQRGSGSAAAVDWEAPGVVATYADRLLDLLAARGLDVRGRVAHRSVITPADLERRTRAGGGAIYGTSSNGPRSAFLRPANRSPVPGLFLVGGSSHPGGGLPLVTLSARIVADLVGPA
jgi:phytoene desaturase